MSLGHIDVITGLSYGNQFLIIWSNTRIPIMFIIDDKFKNDLRPFNYFCNDISHWEWS